MGRLGNVLEMMQRASVSFRTASGTVRHRQDAPRMRSAIARYRAAGGRSGPCPPAKEAAWEVVSRFLVDRPDRFREERTLTDDSADHRANPSLLVVDGQRWWMHDTAFGAFEGFGRPNHGTYTRIGFGHMLDPRAVAVALDLAVVGPALVAGRPGIRLRGTPARPAGEIVRALDYFNCGATSHDLVVDEAHGVLLRSAALLDGQEFDVMDLLEVHIGQEVTPEDFSFMAPDGLGPRPLPEVREMTPEDCRGFTGFGLWLPVAERAPHLAVHEPWSRDGQPSVRYRVYLADQKSIDVELVAAGEQVLVRSDQTTAELHGSTAYLRRSRPGHCVLACVLAGTVITLRGNVDDAKILAFARSLRPASEIVP